jgi:hypothetical protein
MAQFVWDHQVSPNLCALTIYLKLVHAFENRAIRFHECQYEDDDIFVFLQTLVPNDGHYY